MIKFIILFLISFHATAAIKIEMNFSSPSLRQGMIVKAKITLDSQSVQSFDIQKLKGNTFGKTVYFQSVAPLLMRSGEQYFESDVKVVFAKVPSGNSLADNSFGEEILLTWNPVTFATTETDGKLILADFDIPKRNKMFFWVLPTIGFFLCLLGAIFFWLKWSKKNRIKLGKRKLRDSLFQANQYDEIVEVWKNKRTYIETFPILLSSFERLEKTLFLYQFKSYRSEQEIQIVLDAYKEFLNEVRGGLNGI